MGEETYKPGDSLTAAPTFIVGKLQTNELPALSS